MLTGILRESKDFFSEIDQMEARKWSWRFKFGEISEHDSQIFRRTWRISGPEVADGAKADVPTTDRENEKKKKHRPFYEAVDAHARRRLKKNTVHFMKRSTRMRVAA